MGKEHSKQCGLESGTGAHFEHSIIRPGSSKTGHFEAMKVGRWSDHNQSERGIDVCNRLQWWIHKLSSIQPVPCLEQPFLTHGNSLLSGAPARKRVYG